MKLSIMQPYFFPYIGYFALIKQADQFIIFNTAQYIRHGWIDRNRILKQNGEPLYIKVPLKKHTKEVSIRDLRINNSETWKEKIFAQLMPYRKKAPNYWKVISLLKEILKDDFESLTDLNYNILINTCSYLGILKPIKIWSDMKVRIDEVNAPDEWALNICKALNADTYYNPIGGTKFFDYTKYKNAGIELKFLEMIPGSYKQLSNVFVPFLSIIDVLMFCEIDEANDLIDNFKFKSYGDY